MAKMIPISLETWKKKYKDPRDNTVEDMWSRTARWVSSKEINDNHKDWEENFYDILEGFKFLPGGRIVECADTPNPYANNCFGLPLTDDLEDIFEMVKRSAIISKKNGGCGFNLSPLRPKDAPLSGGGTSSGVVSWMKVFDVACEQIKSGGKNRRAALIFILNVDHPDIFQFIDAKRQSDVLNNCNISVAVSESFMKAVKINNLWDLKFNGVVYDTVPARDLWNKLCYSGWMHNDPGIMFIDEVNKYNNAHYLYNIDTLNPCGEITLPHWGVCCLGNVNLTQFVTEPFAKKNGPIKFDLISYRDTIRTAVRFLDNVLDVTSYPYEENRKVAQNERRIGLNGLAGLGSTLAMLRMPYDSEEGREFAATLARICRDEAYRASIELAKEKGSFPAFDVDKYMDGEFIKSLPKDIQLGILEYGIRNIALLTAPPVGTGSILANYISNGIEPIFDVEYERDILNPDGTKTREPVMDYAWSLWMERAESHSTKPDFFRTAMEIDPKDHIRMQAALQKFIDNSISKTINLPADYTLDDYKEALIFAHENGLKGITTYRDGTRDAVLIASNSVSHNKKDEPSVSDVTKDVVEFERPRALDAKSYQILEASGNHTYCTLAYAERDGVKQPWEMFMNASGENAEWYAIIGRLASRLMRKTGDVQGVIKELKSIGGDNGYFTQQYGYMKSRPQHIGFILEEYVEQLGTSATLATLPEIKTVKTTDVCEVCGGAIVKRGGCKQCENGCVESYKCG